MNYIGPNNGQGIRVYQDAELVANAATLYTQHTSPGDGEIAIGKLHIETPGDYGSVVVEMVFFEENLGIDRVHHSLKRSIKKTQ